MFFENNLGKNSSIFEHELRLPICNNEIDFDEYWRSIVEHYINSTMTLPSFVNISRIKKFKDLCDEDVVGRNFSITNFIKEINFITQRVHFSTYVFQSISNFSAYSLPIFIILGLLGNSLSIFVLFRKNMRSFSSNIYLGVLAICDILHSMKLLIEWLYVIAIKPNENWYWFIAYWLIPFVNFVTFFSQFLSVWLIVAFTIERYIVTKYPLLRRSWCTVKRAKIVVTMLMGLAILHSILKIFIIGILKFESKMKKNRNFYDVYNQLKSDIKKGIPLKRRIIDSVIIFTLPALIIVICNTLIGYHIYQQNRVRKTMITASDSSNGNTQISNDKMLQYKITKMLVLVSSIFVILKLPKHYFIFFITYIKFTNNMLVIYQIFNLLDIVHYSINFVLYCATGQNFRRELMGMFTKRTNIKKKTEIS